MRKNIIIIAINIFFLTVFLVCQVISAGIAGPLHAGMAAEAWAGQSGERFAQLAVYFPYSYTFDEEAIYKTRQAIDTSLRTASLEATDDHRLYADAWSAKGSASVTGKRGKTTASIVGVGGDFFLFHPLYLRSGSYISPNDIMRDRVVLDEELAWRLYGSTQLAGLDVEIDGRLFVIAGVVAREADKASSKAYSGGAGLFMSYEALNALSSKAPEDKTGKETQAHVRINCYEIVMPDVITNFAMTSLSKVFNDDESLLIVDNTSRFSEENLFGLIGSFGERSMRTDDISFPYWENATRYAEDWLALLFFISLLSMICPTVFAVIYAVKLIRFGVKKGKEAIRAELKAREDRAYTRYMQQRRIQRQDTL